jgi:uncharacterized protein YjbI with pentapeptide repeats
MMMRNYSILQIILLSVSILLGACAMAANDKPELTGEKEDLLKNKAALSAHTQPINISGKTLTKFHIDEHDVQNLHIRDSDLIKYAHRRSKITNSSYSNVNFNIASFTDSTLTHVTFENSTFKEVGFIDSSLIGVTFINCIFNNSKFSGLKGKAIFINSTLNAPDFMENEAVLEFDNSTITNASNPRVNMFDMQKLPAAITLKDSQLYGAKVDGALTSIKISGGSIIKTGIGGTIGSLEIDHAKLDFSTSGNFKTITVSNADIERFAFGDTIDHATITDCQRADDIALISAKINTLNIDRCDINTFEPLNSTLVHFDIRNSQVNDMDLHQATIQDFLLNNVSFTKVNIEHAQAAQQHFTNVRISSDGSLKDSGSNIKLH